MSYTLILFAVLVALSAFFSGVEIAFFSLSAGKVHSMVKKKLPGAREVERLRKKPRRLLTVILIGNNLVNILAASVATELSIKLFGSTGVGIATGFVTLVVLVFGEIFPKTIAQVHAREISRHSAKLILVLQYALFPIVYFFERISTLVVKMVPGASKIKPYTPEDEIKSLVDLGVKDGSVEEHEKEFVERLFKFSDRLVSAVTTPLDKIIMLDVNQSIDDAIQRAADSGYSRFPVYKNKRTNVIGTAHIKDLVRTQNAKGKNPDFINMLRLPLYVSESDFLDDVFTLLQNEHSHIALVKNSEDKLVGMITLEDVMEELFGEIFDESDRHKQSVVT